MISSGETIRSKQRQATDRPFTITMSNTCLFFTSPRITVKTLYFITFLLCLSPERCNLLASGLYPVILVPGQSGNQLEARLTEAYQPSVPGCEARRNKGWFRIWLNYAILQDSQSQRCFAEQMSLFYDEEADDYRNVLGVETRVPFFGSTKGVLYLDPDNKESTSYMAVLVQHLEGIGYTQGQNLFAAPYDFRYGLAAHGHSSQVGSQFLQDLRQLVQHASKLNDDKPVIFLTHSMGGLLTLQFLNRSPAEWRARFVKHFIALATPWGGTVIEMINIANGTSLQLPFVDPKILVKEARSRESNLWLLPSPAVFREALLVIAKQGNYSATRMSEFLDAIGFSEGIRPYITRILPLLQELNAPLVPVTVITGVGVDTAAVLIYGERGFNELPEIIYGDGDGIVNLVSLLVVESLWSKLAGQDLKVIKIPNISHVEIVKHESGLREILGEVLHINYGDLIFNV